EQPDGGAVAGRAQRGAQRHLRGLRVLVLRNPGALQRLDGLVQARDDRRRGPALLQRDGEDERLERRARLAPCLRRAVDVAALEAAAPDERAHLAGLRVERDQRPLQRLVVRVAGRGRAPRAALLDLVERLPDRRFRGGLHVHVDGRADAEPAFVHLLEPEARDELPPYLLLEPG